MTMCRWSLAVSLLTLASALACSGGSDGQGTESSSGGTAGYGGNLVPAAGVGSGGTAGASEGMLSGGTAGLPGSGGTSPISGGAPAVGGLPQIGGGPAAGGATVGGASSGGATVGGASSGGATSGGATVGGASSGGSGGGSIGSDNCTDTLASGVTISEIAVFQSGKIPIMQDGAAVTPVTEYGAEIIEGRESLFRIYVNVDDGFQARKLSARLTLNGAETPYYAVETISGSSTELSLANSFAIDVPASAIQSDLSYSVRIVECDTGSGTAHNPQFPDSGEATLATRQTGIIRVTLLPVTSDGVTANVTDELKNTFKSYLDAMYPTTDAQLSVASTPLDGCTVSASTASDGNAWSDCLDAVRARRQSDAPDNDVYYFGILMPTADFRDFCSRSCISGISFVTSANGGSMRASLGIGYLPYATTTMAHELGHAHGREHSPGCGADQADPNFPYLNNNDEALIGWVGWDHQSPDTLLDPQRTTDIMAYCDDQWVSDYVYADFADRVAALNLGMSVLTAPSELGTWRVLNAYGSSARWGRPITDPSPAVGNPVDAVILDAADQPIDEVTAYRTDIAGDIQGATYLIPEPRSGWSAVAVDGITAKF